MFMTLSCLDPHQAPIQNLHSAHDAVQELFHKPEVLFSQILILYIGYKTLSEVLTVVGIVPKIKF